MDILIQTNVCLYSPHTHTHTCRAYYRGALCAVLEQQQTSREQTSREETSRLTAVAPAGVAGDLLAMMSADWDKGLVETDIFWLALHLARYMYMYYIALGVLCCFALLFDLVCFFLPSFSSLMYYNYKNAQRILLH